MRIWGSHYEMGYAHASLLGDYIVTGVDEIKDLVGDQDYALLRLLMAAAVWKPPEIEDELDGMVDSLAETHPSAAIDKIDLKVVNTYGDWGYQCRSHICWGRYVAPPIKTLATRRLDFGSPTDTSNHHVLAARDPDDNSPKTLESHWALLASGGDELHMMSVAYRGRGDMTIWADGRLDPPHGGRTPRLEWEWNELFGPEAAPVPAVSGWGLGITALLLFVIALALLRPQGRSAPRRTCNGSTS